MKKLIYTILLLAAGNFSFAQCNTNNVSGDLIITSDIFMSGVYTISGNFIVQPGVTVYVEPYSFSSCGKLEIHAAKITIEGTIDGNAAGYLGGAGGNGGSSITSLTGDQASLINCNNEDNSGLVNVEGGFAGLSGSGAGGGLSGQNGTHGSGPKQTCQTWDDEAGVIGSSGGAGGGGGGSYGGIGSGGAQGGDGSDDYLSTDIPVSTAYTVIQGNGGNGGNAGSLYGTSTGMDYDAGSGGAGGGGGGRSYYVGTNGGKGGNGGAGIYLHASDSLIISGNIFANGENGLNGGDGGDGGVSEKCCSDGCDDCGEATVSAGAGAGSGGGGGSGGSILIESDSYIDFSGILSANGGNGGVGGSNGDGATCNYGGGGLCGGNSVEAGSGEAGATGGAGGGGRIKIKIAECANSSVTGSVSVLGGSGNGTASAGTNEIICSGVGIAETEMINASVYPNPSQEEIFIEIEKWSSQTEIEISDLNGKILWSQLSTQSITRMDVSFLPSGFYFCKIKTKQSEIFKKFIRQ